LRAFRLQRDLWRPGEAIAETQPRLQPALLRLSAMISQYFMQPATTRKVSLPRRDEGVTQNQIGDSVEAALRAFGAQYPPPLLGPLPIRISTSATSRLPLLPPFDPRATARSLNVQARRSSCVFERATAQEDSTPLDTLLPR